MFEGKRVAVVVPAYNEARLLPGTVRGVPAWVDSVIVVDDASRDDTARVVPVSARVSVIVHARNRGVGAAIASGYARALDAEMDVVAVMAGDGQMDPLDLARVVRPIALGRADYVKGNRFGHPDAHAAMPLQRRLAGRVLGRLTSLAAGVDGLTDSQCGFTAIGKRALQGLRWDELWPRYGYPNELIGLLARGGFSIEEVVVRPVYRGEASGLKTRDVATILRLLWQVNQRRTRRVITPSQSVDSAQGR